jgi:hypothetical protein
MRKCFRIFLLLVASTIGCASNLDVTEPGKVCEVHGTPLQVDVVPITYGMIRRPAEVPPCKPTIRGGVCRESSNESESELLPGMQESGGGLDS